MSAIGDDGSVRFGTESPPLVLLVADADLAQTHQAVIESEQAEISIRARLAAVIGWPTTTLPPLSGSLPELQTMLDTEALLDLMAEHHPSVRTRESMFCNSNANPQHGTITVRGVLERI